MKQQYAPDEMDLFESKILSSVNLVIIMSAIYHICITITSDKEIYTPPVPLTDMV